MPAKLKANGTVVATLGNQALRDILAKGGKQGHKARMELIKRKVLTGSGKDEFQLIVEADLDHPAPQGFGPSGPDQAG
jgi:hypothetical protein